MEEYRGKKIIVRWDIMKCAHAGRCVKALPAVFDVSKDPWVDANGADPEAVKQAVKKCPSGALSCQDF